MSLEVDPPDDTATSTSTPGHTSQSSFSARSIISDGLSRYSLVLVWLIVIAVFGVVEPSTFLSSQNFQTIFGSQAVLAVLTLGLLLPLTAGDFDLSIASVLSLSSMTIAILNVQHGWPIGAAIVVALLIGACIGFVNGAFIVLLGLDAFIMTLATGTILAGVVYWISDSNTISGISSSLINVVVFTRFLGISMEFYYALALCAILWYVFEFTPLGRRLLFVGQGRSVARLVGVRVGRVRWGSLVASATISAFAGVLYAGTEGGADPISGGSFLLPTFAAAFLGATTIVPGRFNPWGAVIAVYFLVTGITGLELLGVQAFVQNLFYGGALAVAVAASTLARRQTRAGAV